ncbi:tyrosinase family oxidase copper chaperone [Streptomyces sp. NPDC048604]|uniref:tyrosinase family oxidase copper chaperone n=1 Tax=Streptomyces sp. NPDC048604 TaxID=3365578 RepID=UPI003713DA43
MSVPRRYALRTLFAVAVTAFTGGALARIAAKDNDEPRAGGGRPGFDFDEVHRGRRVQGEPLAGGAVRVRVDGRPLHVMRCADGGWLTPLDHYRSCPTPLDAARAAVDALGSAQLSPLAAAHGGHPGGSPRGVRA